LSVAFFHFQDFAWWRISTPEASEKKSLKKVVKKFGREEKMILSLHPLSPHKWGG
jgi:hypothetical protein